ncbi:MAG TPA: hypothetical protein VN962_07495 [Polyangia bacterium]|nr:hypothetical protein [Polyangia bacterium]
MIAALLGAPACKREARPEQAHEPSPTPRRPDESRPEPQVLLSLPVSAYHASLVAREGDAVDLLAESAVYRLSPGHPAVRTPLQLGAVSAVRPSGYVTWSQGAVRELPADGGPARRIAAVPEQPQVLVASAAGVAWIEGSPAGPTRVQTSRAGRALSLYTSPGRIDAAAMVGERVYFVERPGGPDWRIGSVGLTGGAATFTPARPGRSPSLLAAGRDLAFYLGAGFEVHRLSLDLQHERTVASGFICSPLAVAEALYCSQPEGLFELAPDVAPRWLAPGSLSKPVTDLAVAGGTLFWIADDGTDRLQVSALPLRR